MKDQTLTIQEAAKFLGVSTKTLRRWDASGRLSPERTVGNQRRYSGSKLETFLQTKPVTVAAPKVESQSEITAPIESEGQYDVESVRQEATIADAQPAFELEPAFIPAQEPVEAEPIAVQPEVMHKAEEPETARPFGMFSQTPDNTFTSPTPSFDHINPITKYIKTFLPGNGHPNAAMALAGAISVVVLFFFVIFGLGQAQMAGSKLFGFLTGDKSANGGAVLAADDQTPDYLLRVNVPAVFGQKVSFLSSVAIEKELSVKGKATLSGGVVTNNANIDAGTGTVTASNLVYSVLAGTNISITGDPQNPTISADVTSGVTSFQGQEGAIALAAGSGIGLDGLTITNAGVLSVQGQSGAVTFTGGSGVSVSGTTISNTDAGSAQNIFKKIITPSSTIDASSNTDSLTFAAGSGITITGDAGSKTVTITSTANGTLSGLTPNGVLYATNTSNATTTAAGLNGTVLKGVTGGAPVFGAVNLTSDITGALGVANGGTGLTATPTNGQVLIGNGSGFSLATISPGAGLGITNGSGTISLSNNGVLSVTGTANQIATSGSTGAITLSLPQDIHTGAAPTFASMNLTSNTNHLILGTGNTGTITMATLTSGRTYTLPDASGEICLSIGNCPGGGGGTIGGSGTANYLPRFSGATTLGNSLLYDTGSKIGLGTISPEGLFSVSGAGPGKALVSLDEIGDQNILTGSASGTTRFVFDRSGNLNLVGGGVQINGTNVLTSNTLGSGVTTSSLTSVSTLTSGAIGAAFGSIDVGTDSISGGDITATGTTGITITGNGAGITFSGTGNHIVSASSGTLQIGAATLTGAITANSQNITGINNLSAAGTITFGALSTGVLKSNGSGVVSSSAIGLNTADVTGTLGPTNGGTGLNSFVTGDLIYASGANALAARAIGSSGQILTVQGGVPVWADAGGTINFWQRNSGALSSLNVTDDLLVGGTATSSALFQISGTTGDASTSGTLTFKNAGSIQTTSNQTLTIGGNSTGNITLSPLNGNGSVTSTGDLNLASGKGYQINGANVLTASTLGSGVTSSSLTTVGALTSGSIASGFGTISTGNNITTTATVQGGNVNATTAVQTGGTSRIDASGNLVNINNITAGGAITFSGLGTNNGLLYTNGFGVLQQAAAGTSGQILVANGSGVPTFVTVGTDATIDATGALTISANAVALGTDTTGNYVGSVSGGNGIGVTGSAGEGWTPSLALSTLTADWDQTGAFDIILNNAASELQIKESAGNTYFGTIDVGDLSANRTYTFPDVTGTICLVEAGNCAGSGTGVTTAGGTTNRLARFTGAQAVGNASIEDLYTSGVALTIDAMARIGIGTASPTGLLTVSGGNFGGNAAAVFNQTGASSNDIITASASGTTKFTINNNGNVQFAGNTSFINTLTSVATANRTYTLPDTTGTICLVEAGNCAGSGGGLIGAGTNGQIAFFTGAGTLTSETSGFAWDATNKRLGIGNDTPVAKFDVAGANIGKALVIFDETGDQNILTGSASGTTRFVFDRTGNLNLNGGAYQIGGTTVLSSTTLGSGVTSSSLTTVGALAGGSIANGFGTIATSNTITGTTINGTTGINTGASAGTQRIDASGNLVNIGTITASGSLTFSNYTTDGGILYTNGSGVVGQTTAGTSGQVLVSNAGGAPDWMDAASLGTNYWQRSLGALASANITDDLLVGGNATSSAKFQIFGLTGNATTSGTLTFNTAGSIQTTNNQTLTIGGATTGNITLSPLNGNGSVTSTGDLNLATGKGYQINGANVLTSTALGSSVVGSSLTSVGALTGGSIGSGFGTIATANTITGTTLNGTTGINTGASAGTQRIDASGNLVNIGTIDSSYLDTSNTNVNLASGVALNFNGTTIINSARELESITGLATSLNPTAANTYALGTGTGNQFSTIYGQTLYQSGNQVCDTSGNCSGLSVNFWDQNSGAIIAKNSTVDFLVGGTASSSAKFAVLNMNNGTPTASVSALANGAAYITAAGTIQTTNNQTLTLGGNTTGNVVISPLNGSGTITANGTLTLASGKSYQINGTDVLTATSLGSGVTGSSLTSVGALASGSIASGFGTIATSNTITGTTINGTTGINTGAGAGTLRIDNNGNLSNIGTINASGAITLSNLGAGIVKSSSGGLLSSSALNLASGAEITGTLGVGNGGTGFTSYAQGDLLYGNGSSTLSKLAAGSDGQILSLASGTPTWISSSSINFWQRANGAVAPLNITDDLLLGATATNSAKIAFKNIASGTPTASISANSGDNATFITGTGNLGTTNAQTLQLGSTGTGNVSLNPGGTVALTAITNGFVGIGTAAPLTALHVVGAIRTSGPAAEIQLEPRDSGALFSFFADSAGLHTFQNGAGDRMLITPNGTIGVGTSTPLGTLDLRARSGILPVASISGSTSFAAAVIDQSGNGDIFTASKSGATKFVIRNDGSVGINTASAALPANAALGIYATSDSDTSLLIKQRLTQSGNLVNIVDSNDSSIFKIDNFGHITTTNDVIVGRALGVGTAASSTWANIDVLTLDDDRIGLNIRGQNGQTANLLNLQTDFGVNDAWFDESANLRIGSSAPDAGKLNVTGGYTGKALAIFNETGNQDIFTASSSGTSRFTIKNDGSVGIGTTAPGSKVEVVGAVRVSGSDAGFRMQAQDNSGDFYSLYSAAGELTFYGGNSIRAVLTSTGRFGLGLNNWNPQAQLDVKSGLGTLPIASFSGQTSSAGVIIDNNGVGDLFTASKSGASKFTVLNNGNIQMHNYTTNGGLLYTNGSGTVLQTTAGGGGQCLTSDGSGGFNWSTCAAGANLWQINNGALSPASITNDLLLGGTATASAKFAVLNMAGSGTPTASIAGTTTNAAAYLDGDGNLGTTNARTLSLGTSSTGNVVLAPGGSAVLTALANGTVGIGTTTGTNSLNIGDGGITINRNGGLDPNLIFSTNGTAQAQIRAATDGSLAFTNGNAGTTYGIFTATGSFGLGTGSTPLARLDVRGNSGTTPIASVSGTTAMAGMVVDNNGVGDLFTASKSGASKFTVLNNGNIQMHNYTTNGGLLYTNGTGTVAQLGAGTTGQCLTANTGAAPSWTTCSVSANLWQQNNGTVSPFSNTLDLLIGGTATSSAKFAFINNLTGTPTASIAGATTNVATYITGEGNIGTTNKQTLTLGTTSTGNISLAPGGVNTLNALASGRVGIGTSNPEQTLDVIGNFQVRDAESATKGYRFRTGGGALDFEAANAAMYFSNWGSAGFNGTQLNYLQLEDDVHAAHAQGLWRFRAGNTGLTGNELLTIDGPGTEDIVINEGGTANTDLRIEGDADANLLFTQASSDRIGVGTNSPLAKFDIRGGAGLNSGTIPVASISGNTAKAGLIVDNNGTGDLFTASKSGLTHFVINNAGNVGIGTSNPTAKLQIAGSGTGAALFGDGTFGGSYMGLSLNGTLDQTNYNFLSSPSDSNLYINRPGSSDIVFRANNLTQAAISSTGNFYLTNGKLGVNTSNFLATLDVRGQVGTLPVASASGTTAMAAMVVDNNGVGDLFTASKSGATKFVINNSGDIQWAGQSGFLNTLNISALTAARTWSFPNATGTIVLTGNTGTLSNKTLDNTNILNIRDTNFTLQDDGDATKLLQFQLSGITTGTTRTLTVPDANGTLCLQGSTACGFAVGTNYWQSANAGAISPFVNTVDLLIGGTSTASAKFAFINTTGSGTPTATISGSVAGAAVSLTGDGVLSTTLNRSLQLNPNGGNVGVGTNNPNDLFNVNGSATIGNGATDRLGAGLSVRGAAADQYVAEFYGRDGNYAGFGVFAETVGAKPFIQFGDGAGGVGVPTSDWTINSDDANFYFRPGNIVETPGLSLTSIQASTGRASLGIGMGTGTHLATLDVRNSAGTVSTASFSGATSFAGLMVDNSGVGDLFTASKSGSTKFTIRNSGDIIIGSSAVAGDLQTLNSNALNIGTGATGNINLGTDAVARIISAGNNTGATALNFTSGTGSQTFTSSVATTTGSNGAFVFNANALTSGDGLYLSGNAVTSGTLLSVVSTSTAMTSGNLAEFNWSPSAPATTSGNLVDIGIGANGDVTGKIFNVNDSGSSLFAVDESVVSSFLPAEFLAAGDVSIAYDLVFTNPDSSNIKSSGPMYLQAGEGWNSSDLTLRTFNYGNIIFDLDGVGSSVGINSETPLGTLDLRGNSGTQPIATVSGATTFAAMIVDNNSTGDLFTASKSGATKFVIKNNGDLRATNYSTAGGVFYGTSDGTLAISAAGTSGQCLQSNGASAPTWGSCDAAPSVNAFTITQGLLHNGNLTTDFAIGGNSSASAKFKVSMSGTQATATVSGLTSMAAMVVNQNGVGDVFTASKSGKTFFTVKNNGVIQMGNDSDGLSFDYLNGGPNYVGRARPTKQIVLSPEYIGGVITASGSASTDGDFTADASASATTSPLITLNGTGNRYLTYYEWSSEESTFQDYTVGVRVTLPADFSSWTPGGSAIQVVYNTELGTSTSNKLDMFLYPSSSATPTVYRQTQNTASKTWATLDIPATDLNDGTPWNAASQSAMLYFKMSSKDGNYVQLGDIILNYLSKF